MSDAEHGTVLAWFTDPLMQVKSFALLPVGPGAAPFPLPPISAVLTPNKFSGLFDYICKEERINQTKSSGWGYIA